MAAGGAFQAVAQDIEPTTFWKAIQEKGVYEWLWEVLRLYENQENSVIKNSALGQDSFKTVIMMAEATPSISKPMLIVVVLRLVMIFLGFSLIAPPNATASLALIASALCVAGAIFLIRELDRPFDGLMRISSEPMLNVLRQLGKGEP